MGRHDDAVHQFLETVVRSNPPQSHDGPITLAQSRALCLLIREITHMHKRPADAIMADLLDRMGIEDIADLPQSQCPNALAWLGRLIGSR